jgi:hypothetical protein
MTRQMARRRRPGTSRRKWLAAAVTTMVVAAWAAASVLGLPQAAQADTSPLYAAATVDPGAALAEDGSGAAAAETPLFPVPDPSSISWGRSLSQPGNDVAFTSGSDEPPVITPAPSATPQPGPYKQLLKIGVNVQQRWNYTCVAASVQTELLMALGFFDTSAGRQIAIYNWARAHLGFSFRDSQPGLDFIAWSRALNYFSGGKVKYSPVSMADGAGILVAMAKAMRTSGLPQGADIRGATHAITIIGYVASADPATARSFTVTGVYVAGPYMRWRDPPTGTYLAAADFLAYWGTYTDPYGFSPYNGKYLAVIGTRA